MVAEEIQKAQRIGNFKVKKKKNNKQTSPENPEDVLFITVIRNVLVRGVLG